MQTKEVPLKSDSTSELPEMLACTIDPRVKAEPTKTHWGLALESVFQSDATPQCQVASTFPLILLD